MTVARWVRLGALLATFAAASSAAQAEFYRWTDARGQVRISNIPPPAIASDGSVKAGHHPQSIRAQQQSLRARLQARDAALAASAAENHLRDAEFGDDTRSK